MKNKKRKGFTLVELLVVIAILAILATVAILGYTQFTKKANISNDQAICSQMNLALQSNEALDNKAQYAQQAVDQCREAGFILENLTPSTTGYHFAYDQQNNRFMLLDDKFYFNYGDTKHSEIGSDNVNVFVVVGNQIEFNESKEKDFSAYLRHDFDETVTTLTTDKGIDVGECTTIKSINYINNAEKQDVVIRTNSAKTILTLEAPNDVIHHYDLCGKVEANQVAKSSYHEHGTVNELEVTYGRVVIEPESKVDLISLVATKNETTNYWETKDIILASNNGAELPAVGFAEVSCGANETVLVLEVQDLSNTETIKDTKYITITNHTEAFEEKMTSDVEFYDNKELTVKSESVPANLESATDVTIVLSPDIFWTDLEECGISQKNANNKMGSAQQVTVQQCIEANVGFTKYWVKLGTLSQNVEIETLGIGDKELFNKDSKTSDSIGNNSNIVDKVFYQEGKDLYVCCSFCTDYFILQGEKLVINGNELFAAPTYMMEELSLTFTTYYPTKADKFERIDNNLYLFTYCNNSDFVNFYSYSYNVGEGNRLTASRVEEHQIDKITLDTSLKFGEQNGGFYCMYYGENPGEEILNAFYDIHSILVVKDGKCYFAQFRVNWTQAK